MAAGRRPPARTRGAAVRPPALVPALARPAFAPEGGGAFPCSTRSRQADAPGGRHADSLRRSLRPLDAGPGRLLGRGGPGAPLDPAVVAGARRQPRALLPLVRWRR